MHRTLRTPIGALASAWLRVLGGLLALAGTWPIAAPARADDALSEVTFRQSPGELTLLVDARPALRYVYADRAISRPYFTELRGPTGTQLSRHHPPRPGIDAVDHDLLHPGLWMAFGSLGGEDYWRNAARVAHDGFDQDPQATAGEASFAVRNRYLTSDGSAVVCHEVARYRFAVRPSGYLLLWDSTFTHPEHEVRFGVQDEMGIGVRVATPLTELAGGQLRSETGAIGAANIWGTTGRWCDYSGQIDGEHLGVAILCHPANPAPSWFHARNYGLLAANPAGPREVFEQRDVSHAIRPGDGLRLRYGVLLHARAGDEGPDIEQAYQDYVQLSAGSPR